MRRPDAKVVLLGGASVGKTSLLRRYTERRFPDSVSTVGGAFYLKPWRALHLSIWDTAGREQFHGLGSMYCRGAAAVILTYDVTHLQSLVELEDRFLGLTDSANKDCLFVIVGNKVDLTEEAGEGDAHGLGQAGGARACPRVPKQVLREDAVALYKKILRYKMLDEKDAPAAEHMCFETSAKTGHNVDLLFEAVFDMVVPMVLQQKAEEPVETVDLTGHKPPKQARPRCCS
ncbi:Ras-related protein Rab-20 [Heterocephalus glaber]|uniref:Ras-related protein Rab-20 n=1 Tax=Heterocephalus glaber TaxID=10181 RepID=G5AZ46_HETGA|nr:ras-related protein Rab-20 [Heterocephalus glaber]EHB02307.1 Ras-related protein Rab-20 [Heterocephalus glaber]